MKRAAVVMVVVAVTVAAGQEKKKPEVVVSAAVEAAGGTDALKKLPAGRVVGKGTITFAGVETPITFEQVYQVPGRLRTLITAAPKGQKYELLQIVANGKVAHAVNGKPVPVPESQAKDALFAAALLDAGHLLPLMEKRFTLKSERGTKELAVLHVQLRGQLDFRLGFDRKSGNLVRITQKVADADSGRDVESETTFSDFQTVNGLTRPFKSVVTHDGKKVAELTVEKFTPFEKIDAGVFAIPE